MKYSNGVAVVLFTVVFICITLFQVYRENHSSNNSIETADPGNIRAGGRRTDENKTYEEARGLIKKVLSLIYNRYEFGGPYGNKFFMASNNLSPETWDILKFKLATKMLTTNSTFLMTFSGSSVTAEHDNYYAQSYPYIFKKRMGDIFAKVGIELVVHDIAMGANNCSPYVLCYESMGGSDPDFLNWEQVCLFSTFCFAVCLCFSGGVCNPVMAYNFHLKYLFTCVLLDASLQIYMFNMCFSFSVHSKSSPTTAVTMNLFSRLLRD